MKTIFIRELIRNRKSFFIWTIILVLANVMMMAFYPTFAGQAGEYEKMMAQFSPEMRNALNLNLNFGEILQYFAYVFQYIILFSSIYAMVLAAGIVSREEGEKTIEFLLAKPVNRREVISAKALCIFVYMILFNIIFTATNYLAFETFKQENYDLRAFFLLSLGQFLMQVMFAAIGLLVSVWVPKSKSTTPISLGVVFGTYFIYIAQALSDKLENLKYLTPFVFVNPASLVEAGRIEPVYWIIMLGVTVICTAGAYLGYERKNISG